MLPFLLYLTVFRSRLGAVNAVLANSSFAHQPERALSRKLRNWSTIKIAIPADDPSSNPVFEYLLEKKLVSPDGRAAGRYGGLAVKRDNGRWRLFGRDGAELTEAPVYLVDVLMSDPSVRSTVGTPTPDNVQELIDLAFQLRFLSKGKTTWTAAAHSARVLRRLGGLDDSTNPFVLGHERVVMLRQLVDLDGVMLREIARHLAPRAVVRREDIVADFVGIAASAVDAARSLSPTPAEVRELRGFRSRIETTSAKRPSMSQAPGVLEHRVTARLEWLTDLGYLAKPEARNAFTYHTTPGLERLVAAMDSTFGKSDWGDVVAISEWHEHPDWRSPQGSVPSVPAPDCFVEAYALLRRKIGPSPLREVAFLAAILSSDRLSFSRARENLIRFAQRHEGASLSGGRYTKNPENIYIADTGISRDF